AEPIFQVIEIAREAEDRHDLRSDGDVEAVLAREPISCAAEGANGRAQGPVVHVENAPPSNAPRIDAERVAEINVLVDDRGQEIIGRGNGVEVAGEVQIDILHRHALGISAAGGATLNAE